MALYKETSRCRGRSWKQLDHFQYLGTINCDEDSRREVLSRAAQTMAALARLKIIWKDKNIRIKHKIRLMRALVITIFRYAFETWTLTAEPQRRIQSLEFGSSRKILSISYKDRITNEQMRKTIIKHIGPYEDLLATIKRRKRKWYGHVTRSDDLTKVILQGTVEGSRRRGRPKKIWIENIAEWNGISFADTQAMAHNRQEWRELTWNSVRDVLFKNFVYPTTLRDMRFPGMHQDYPKEGFNIRYNTGRIKLGLERYI